MIAYNLNCAPLTLSSLSSKRVDVHFGHVGKAIIFGGVGSENFLENVKEHAPSPAGAGVGTEVKP